MSYVTYITEALVCGGYHRNGADRTFTLFTKDFGLIQAEAKSVREERSRQRFALQDFSRIKVALVKGKTGWRIGSVEVVKNDFTASPNRAVRTSIVKLYRLLRRFIHGQEIQPELFKTCWQVLDNLSTSAPSGAVSPAIDAVIELRLLEYLGYIDGTAVPKDTPKLSKLTLSDKDNFEWLLPVRNLVAQAYKESHL